MCPEINPRDPFVKDVFKDLDGMKGTTGDRAHELVARWGFDFMTAQTFVLAWKAVRKSTAKAKRA